MIIEWERVEIYVRPCEHLCRYLSGGKAKLAGSPDADRERFFVTLQGAALRQHVVKRQLKVRLEAVGIEPEGISPHVLSNSCAIHFLTAGIRLKQVVDPLGRTSCGRSFPISRRACEPPWTNRPREE